MDVVGPRQEPRPERGHGGGVEREQVPEGERACRSFCSDELGSCGHRSILGGMRFRAKGPGFGPFSTPDSVLLKFWLTNGKDWATNN